MLEWGKNHPSLVRGTGLAGEGEGLRDLGGAQHPLVCCRTALSTPRAPLLAPGGFFAKGSWVTKVQNLRPAVEMGTWWPPGGAERGDPAALRPTVPSPWGTERPQGPRAHRSFCLPLVLLRLQIPHGLFFFFFFPVVFIFIFFFIWLLCWGRLTGGDRGTPSHLGSLGGETCQIPSL